LRLATAWAAGEFDRAERGQLTKVIALRKEKYGLHDDVKTSLFPVPRRAKRLRTNPLETQATVSPMIAIEPYIVDLIIQLSRIIHQSM
jgi:hypothetical protein